MSLGKFSNSLVLSVLMVFCLCCLLTVLEIQTSHRNCQPQGPPRGFPSGHKEVAGAIRPVVPSLGSLGDSALPILHPRPESSSLLCLDCLAQAFNQLLARRMESLDQVKLTSQPEHVLKARVGSLPDK